MKRAALLLVLVLVPTAALAAPLVEPHVGGAVFVGPTDAHVTDIFYNPAAAGLLQGTHFYVVGTTRFDYTSVKRATINSANGEPDPSGDLSFGTERSLTITPGGFAGLVADLNNSVTLGLAVYDPFVEDQATTDSSLAYHQSRGYLITTAATISTSYRVTNKLYFGFGFNFEFTKLDVEFLRDSVLDKCQKTPCGVENAANADSYKFNTNFDASPLGSFAPVVSLNLGILFKLDEWWFGASFTTPPLGGGATGINKDASVEITPAGGGATIDADGRISYHLPFIVNVGARRQLFGDYDLVINGRYIGTSAQQQWDLRLFGTAVREAGLPEEIPRFRGYSDTVSIEAGLENQPGTKVRLGARVRFETSAVPQDAVAIDQVDAPKIDLSGGIEWRLSRRFALVGGYSLTVLMPIDVSNSVFTPSAAIDCNASSYDLSTPACAAVRDGRAFSSAAGSYVRIGNELTFGIAYDLW